MRRIPPERSLVLDKRNKKGNCRVPGEGGTEWQMAATRVHNDVLLDSEVCRESETDCADADVDTLVGGCESARRSKVTTEV